MRRFVFAMILAWAMMAAGCAVSPQPFAYHDDRDEKPGPGLLSGEAGGFVIYGDAVENRAVDDTKSE